MQTQFPRGGLNGEDEGMVLINVMWKHAIGQIVGESGPHRTSFFKRNH